MRAHDVEFPDPGISGDQLTINLADIDARRTSGQR